MKNRCNFLALVTMLCVYGSMAIASQVKDEENLFADLDAFNTTEDIDDSCDNHIISLPKFFDILPFEQYELLRSIRSSSDSMSWSEESSSDLRSDEDPIYRRFRLKETLTLEEAVYIDNFLRNRRKNAALDSRAAVQELQFEEDPHMKHLDLENNPPSD